MKVKLIVISIILLLVMVFASGCIPVMEKLGLVSPTNEEQLSPEKGGPPDGLVKILIGFKEKPGAAQQAMVKGLGGKIKYTYNIIPAIAASVPEVAIEALKKNPNITNVELDNKVFALGQTLPWGVNRIDAEVVHVNASGNKGAGIEIAVIDTGIDYYHLDLVDNYAGGYDFVNLDEDPMDDEGHGTHVAGIIAAKDNDFGVVGVAPDAKLYALKVLDDTGSGYMSDVIFAIQWATDPNGNGYAEDRLDIINMSFGADVGNIFLRWACNLAYRDGLLLVAAAGNYGAVCYPAAYSRVIAVSATDYDYVSNKDILADFSSVGTEVELAAPGIAINSTLPGNNYDAWSGTSMASPHVAGTAALVWAANPSWSNKDVRTRLQNTAEDINLLDAEQGYGLVDAENAVLGTTKGNNLPTQQATGTITGTVTNTSGDVITGAEVIADGYSDLTEANGIYSLNDIPVGSYNVNASATGYREGSQQADVSEGETTVVDFVLIPTSVVPMLCVDVVTDKGSYILRETVYIKVTVNDSGQIAVEGAAVHVEITTANGRKYTKDGITDSIGEVTFKFKIKKPDGKGECFVIAEASKSGYDSGTGDTEFNVN